MRKVPKLRFKEFSDEWEEKKLGDICNIKTGKKDTKDKIENGIYPFFVRSQTVEKINSYSYDGEAILTAGDGVGVGKVFHYINGKFDFHQRVYKLSDFKESYCRFIFEIFRKNFKKEVTKYNAKTSVDSVRLEMISEMKITLPILEEQEKIADFLSNIDKKISLTEEKLELFRNYKKGVMQKIFSQELRFKDNNGNDYPEWNYLKAGNIFENISNKNHDGNLPILAVTQDKGVVYRNDLDLKINSSEDGIKNYKIIEPGNFIISLRSFQGGIEYSTILGISSPAYTILKAKIKIIDIFYKFYLKKSSFISELNKTTEGIRDGKQISYSMFSKLFLPYPILEEQQKIADFLSSIDNKIESIEKELEGLKEFKRGLLQQMFV